MVILVTTARFSQILIMYTQTCLNSANDLFVYVSAAIRRSSKFCFCIHREVEGDRLQPAKVRNRINLSLHIFVKLLMSTDFTTAWKYFQVLPLCIFLSRQLRVLGNIRHQCHQVLLLFLFRRLFSSKTLACRPQQYPPAASLWPVPTVAAPAAVPPSFCPVHLILPSQTGTWGLLLVYHEITLLCITIFIYLLSKHIYPRQVRPKLQKCLCFHYKI